MKLLAIRYRITTVTPEKTLSTLIRSGIDFSLPRREEDGFSFSSSIFSKRSVLKWCKEVNCPVTYGFEGVITPIFALKKRPGIIFGGLLAFFLIYLSTFFVWSVRIEGNESISDGEIVRLLDQCGFREGILKSSVDVNEIQNLALARFHQLSFLSINLHGMVADVEVHERITSPKAVDESAPYNLIADWDGVILSSVVLEGQSLFQVGDTVYKGQLLVSGLVDSTSGITNIRHARGKVFARTSRTLTFEIPLEVIEPQYTRVEEARGIRVLGHSFCRRLGNDEGNYDIEVEEKEARILSILLPFTLEKRVARYYEETKTVLSYAEAEERAFEEYGRFISTELDSAQIVEEIFSTKETDVSLILTAEVTAIENIAKEKKIEVME